MWTIPKYKNLKNKQKLAIGTSKKTEGNCNHHFRSKFPPGKPVRKDIWINLILNNRYHWPYYTKNMYLKQLKSHSSGSDAHIERHTSANYNQPRALDSFSRLTLFWAIYSLYLYFSTLYQNVSFKRAIIFVSFV